ncbi:MAG: hypothetical protein ACXU68_07145, partial [Croceibacterium sp.]
MRRRSRIIALGLVALVLPVAAWADDAPAAPKGLHPAPHTEITPYIEADQVLSAEIAPGNDVVTYTTL